MVRYNRGKAFAKRGQVLCRECKVCKVWGKGGGGGVRREERREKRVEWIGRQKGDGAAAESPAKPLRPAGAASSPVRGAFLRGRSPRGKPPHQGRWPRSRPEGFRRLAIGESKRVMYERGKGGRQPAPFAVGGWLPVDGWPRKARRNPSGLASSASSPDGEPFSGCRPRWGAAVYAAGVRGNTRLKSGGRGGGVKNGQ